MTEEDSPSSLAEPVRRRPNLLHALRVLLRTRIVAGLITLIPIWVTWVVVSFLFNAMKSVTEPVARWFADYVHKTRPEITAYEAYLDWIVPVLAVLLTLSLLYMLGLLTASVFGRRIIEVVERVFEQVPLVKQVYRSTKQIVLTLGGGQSHKARFKRVVLVKFPHPGMRCIGFLTSVMKDADTGRPMASVFISTTPNPTTGYMQIIPLEDVSETDWSVEEAVKLLMSGGILSPATVPFDRVRPVHWDPETDRKDDAPNEATQQTA